MSNIAGHLIGRGRSLEATAKKAGMSVERLREVAAGGKASLRELRDIANALRVPIASLASRSDVEPIRLLFRDTAGQRQPTRARGSIDIISDQIQDVLTLVNEVGLDRNTGWLDLFRDLSSAPESAERVAMLFRKVYGRLDDAEPCIHLPTILADELGVFVLFARDPLVEGVSAIVDGYAFVIVAARTFAPRVLFTLAHELGHLVAHHDHRDTAYATIDFQGEINALRRAQRDEERFADSFASSLLLPKRGVLEAIRAIRKQYSASGPLGDIEILVLARFFGVSFEVAARRCEQLGLLPAEGARALYGKLVEQHTNPERRAKELGLPERTPIDLSISQSLINAAVRVVREGKFSVGRVAEILNVPVSAVVAANSRIEA